MRKFKAVLRFISRNGRRVAVTIAGFLLVLIGLAGLVLPILPGWALIFVGLGVLATEYVWARRALEAARERVRKAAERVRGKPPLPPPSSRDPEYPSA
jgi:uncharacterized protein (TIGR02611 family)